MFRSNSQDRACSVYLIQQKGNVRNRLAYEIQGDFRTNKE